MIGNNLTQIGVKKTLIKHGKSGIEESFDNRSVKLFSFFQIGSSNCRKTSSKSIYFFSFNYWHAFALKQSISFDILVNIKHSLLV